MAHVLVPSGRVVRWVDNFAGRHGGVELQTVGGALQGTGADGSTFRMALPFSRPYAGPATAGDFAGSMAPPASWGVLLVRKGGFAVARLAGDTVSEHKVGQRHVQGRTKAGGQSQQRFARRRDNQARQAFEAAAEHAARILRAGPVVTGGDREAVAEVLGDRRLGQLDVVGPWLAVADPRRSVLDQAVLDAMSAVVDVDNA